MRVPSKMGQRHRMFHKMFPLNISVHERHEVATAIDARRDPVQQNSTVECAAERPVGSDVK